MNHCKVDTKATVDKKEAAEKKVVPETKDVQNKKGWNFDFSFNIVFMISNHTNMDPKRNYFLYEK